MLGDQALPDFGSLSPRDVVMQICDLWVDPPPPPPCVTGPQPSGLLSVLISIIDFAFLVQFQIPKVKAGRNTFSANQIIFI